MREELQVVGPRIKVLVDPPQENTSSGGILLALGDKTEDNETGIVVQITDYSYGNFTDKWCDLGDKVLFQRYAGKAREEKDATGTIRYYRVIKDIDVIGVFKQVEDKKDE